MKQETLEEFTKELLEDEFFTNISEYKKAERLIEAGAKWQAEGMYSEEDLREAFRQGMENIDPDFPENMDYSEMYGWSSKLTEQEWFEQFKKK